MQVEHTAIPGVLRFTPRRFDDARGHVSEPWHRDQLADHGIDATFVVDLQSVSRPRHTLRGLHLQVAPHARGRLVRCVHGAMRDVVVDLRADSPTFGRWVATELSGDDGVQVWVPAGCAHGFVTRVPDTITLYRFTDVWAPECARSVRFDDPELAIDWDVPHAGLTLSDADASAPTLAAVWEHL